MPMPIELATAFALVMGLSQNPTALEAARIYGEYEAKIAAAKSLRVEFELTQTEGFTGEVNRFDGLFFMRRADASVQWRVELRRPNENPIDRAIGWAYGVCHSPPAAN